MNKPVPPVKKPGPPAKKAKPDDLDLNPNKDEDFAKLQNPQNLLLSNKLTSK